MGNYTGGLEVYVNFKDLYNVEGMTRRQADFYGDPKIDKPAEPPC